MNLLAPIARSTRSLCFCRCHATSSGDVHEHAHDIAHGRSRPAPESLVDATHIDGAAYRNDPLQAAVACATCRYLHCLALLNDVPELRAGRVRSAFAAARARGLVANGSRGGWQTAWGTRPGELSDPENP